jgi:hypothetical protein
MVISTSHQWRSSRQEISSFRPVRSSAMRRLMNLGVLPFLLAFLTTLLSFTATTAQTYTADFSTQPTIDKYGYAADWPWNSTVTVNLGGVEYLITNAINGSYTWNGSAIVYSTAGDASPLIKRKDEQPFKFYGVKLQYTNYVGGLYQPPFLTVQYATTGGSTQADETYDANTSVTLNKASGVTVTSVSLSFHGLNTLTLDDLIVGPAGGQPTQMAPTVTTAAANAITTNGATLGGNVTADGGATVSGRGTVYSNTNTTPTVGGNGVTTAPNGAGTGTYSATVPGLTAGTAYYVRAYATNSVGTSYGSVQAFTTAPIAPVVTTPANGSLLNTTTPTYAGTAQANATITVYVDGTSIGTTTANGSGTFSLVQPTALNQGSHTVRATAMVGSSAASASSNTNNFTVDTTPPAAPVALTPANGSFTNITTPLYSGTAEANSTVTIIVDGSSIGTTTATASGNWSLSQPTALAQGSHTVRATATDAAGNTSVSSNTNTFTVDTVAPTVSSVSVPANGIYNPIQVLDFTVNFSEAVTVTGSPLLGITVGSTNRQASYYGFVSGPQALVFRYVPRTGDLDTHGITLVSALTLGNGTIRDAAGNTAILTLNNVPSTTGILVDGVAPTVVSSNRQSPVGETTNATSLIYRVTFSESVTNVSTNSFLVANPTGSVSASIASVVAVNGSSSTFDVTLNNVSGNGTLRLDVKGGDLNSTGVVRDIANNEMGASFASGQTFSIDQTPPTVIITSSAGANGGSTRNSPIPFSVTFSEGVTGFETDDIAVTNGTVMGFSGSGTSYTFNVTPSANGPVQVNLAINIAQDAAGNGNIASPSFSISYLPLTLTGFAALSSSVCTGSPLSFSATVSNADGPYSYTLTNGPNSVTGTATGTAFSRTITATGQGVQSFTLLVTDASQRVSASQPVTINALPVVLISGLASDFCQDAAAVTLTGSPAGAGGSFTIDGTSASTLTPMSLTVGQHTVTYRFTDANGCANSTSQSVTIKATPPAPSLLTQTGQSYPGSQSAVTVDLNTGNVTLVASNCAGIVNWTGPNNTAGSGTTIIVPTTQAGTFTYRASCTIDGCTGPQATATVTVGARLTVLHRDVDNYADNNAIQSLLVLQNNSTGTLPFSRLTLRYYLTVENGGTLGNLSLNYAQVGNQNVRLRYVALNPAQQGASGYVEYSFTDGAGNLAAGANSGPIQGYFTKSDYGSLYEPDDYSYNPVRDQLTGNVRITAYYDGVLIAGVEPGSTTQIRAVRALTESKNGPDATQINTYLEVRNEGNVAINYSDLKARYYFTADGNERLQVEVDEGNVSTRLVKLPQAVNGADTYLELTFNQGGQLVPGASTGTIRYRISKPDGGRFNQANDYSYQEQPQDRAQNSRVVVLVSNQIVWGTLPSGASARLAFAEPGSALSVRVLGNPVRDEQVSFEVTGAEGQPLQVQLLTPQGRVISHQRVPVGEATQQHQLSVVGQSGGLFLLQVSTPTQTQTVKVLKAQ